MKQRKAGQVVLGQTWRLGCGQGGWGHSGKDFALLEGCQADSQIQGTWSRALKAARDELCGHMEGRCSRDRVHLQWSAQETARRSGR